jgi:hypothetical protein
MSLPKSEIRQPAKNSDFVAVALLTLALCVATNVAIFALINSALPRFLPFPTPDLLVTVFNTHPIAGLEPHRGDNRKSQITNGSFPIRVIRGQNSSAA